MNNTIYDVPVLDLNFIRGANYGLFFEHTDEQGDPLDLSDQALRLTITKIFGADFILMSEEIPGMEESPAQPAVGELIYELNPDTGRNETPNGSYLTITDAVAGLSEFLITGSELASSALKKTNGGWRLDLIEGPNINLLMYGTVRVISLDAKGGI